MNVAVVNEISAVSRNSSMISALEGRGHNIINAGMKKETDSPELTYIHTGFLSALLLNSGRADLIAGGCGTGAGFLLSCMQYPGVYGGLISNDLDAWLFAQINGGNCISLPLLYGYGWAGDENLRFIIDKFFSVNSGCGYPEHRRESQKKSRDLLSAVSQTSHKKMHEIVSQIDEAVIRPVLDFPGVMEILKIDSLADKNLADALKKRIK